MGLESQEYYLMVMVRIQSNHVVNYIECFLMFDANIERENHNIMLV